MGSRLSPQFDSSHSHNLTPFAIRGFLLAAHTAVASFLPAPLQLFLLFAKPSLPTVYISRAPFQVRSFRLMEAEGSLREQSTRSPQNDQNTKT